MKCRFILLAVSALALAGLYSLAAAQNAASGEKQAKSAGPSLLGGNLIAGLKATPGYLGVEAARTMSGKNVIFAWFENKRAALKWYYSDVHRQLMHDAFPDQEYQKPLKGVPEDSGPILAVACITLSDKPKFKEFPSLRASQISIELYQPLTGGVQLGGRFAPASLKVPGMKDYTPSGKDRTK